MKETDLRLKGVEKTGDLIMTHKRDLEAYHSSLLANEVMWITILPTFKADLEQETEKAKRVSRKVKIALSLFYVMGVLLIAEIMKFSNVI